MGTCPTCSASVAEDARFCPQCGARFVAAAESLTTSVAQGIERQRLYRRQQAAVATVVTWTVGLAGIVMTMLAAHLLVDDAHASSTVVLWEVLGGFALTMIVAGVITYRISSNLRRRFNG